MKPQVETRPSESYARPLCVDMDGTLLRTDTLHERMVVFLSTHFRRAWLLPLWLGKGRAYFKRRLAEETDLSVDNLPCSESFLQFLLEQHRRGRRIILATAADEKTAQQVAGRFRIFSEVIATHGEQNLKGAHKLARLVQMFGGKGFDYAGNSWADLEIWRAANEAILVNAPRRLKAFVGKQAQVTHVFDDGIGWFARWRKVLRLHQWPKNLLLFVPVISGHKLDDLEIIGRVALGLVAFCLCASSAYIINDVHDIEADRAHRTKRFRCFAAGQVPIGVCTIATPLLLAASLACAVRLPIMFMIYLGAYFFTAIAYSWKLKRVALLDVFVLAGLYTLRILAGHGASGIGYSNWLLGFSIFLFLSLSLLKRYVELHRLDTAHGSNLAGRGYRAGDQLIVSTLGLACGCLSALVLALYINSNEVRLLYARPWLLLFTCPLLLYWVSRAWLLASRDQLHDDPVVFALKDSVSYVAGGLVVLFTWLATIQ